MKYPLYDAKYTSTFFSFFTHTAGNDEVENDIL
jgi:hypothetical protein